MDFKIVHKHMMTSESLDEHATAKLQPRVARYVPGSSQVLVTMSVEHDEHIASCDIRGADGFDLHVSERSSNMYATVDQLADKLERQLRKAKEKILSTRRIDEKRHRPEPATTAEA